MKRIYVPDWHATDPAYADEVARLVRVMAEAGYAITPTDAARAWSDHSESELCSGWIALPSDDAVIVRSILSQTVVDPADAGERG